MGQSLFIGIGFVITVLLCIFNIARLTLSKEVRQSTYKKFRIACYCIAGSCACLAIGNTVHIFVRGFTYQPAEICSIISTIISVSQSFLIVISLVVLYTSKRLSVRKIVWNTIPIFGFILAYFIATRFQSDQSYYSLIEFWHSTCTNAPALIRFCFSMFYFLQCGYFAYIIQKSKKGHLEMVNAYISEPTDELRLDWITTAFYAAFGQGMIVIIIEYFPCFATEAIFRIYTIVFYLIFPIYYINYSNTYNKVKTMLTEYQIRSITTDTDDQGIDTMLSKLAERNNQLFQLANKQLVEKQAYLNPEMKIDDLVADLGTNRTYLANAIKQNRQQTIGDYILSLRLEHAKKLLTNTRMRMEDIAAQSGFNSLRTFNRNFKETFNLTPEEYRNQKRTSK